MSDVEHEGKDARWWADIAEYWKGQADQYKLWRDEALRDVADLKQQHAGAIEERRVISHALTLSLKDRVADVSAAKDRFIKRAGEDLSAEFRETERADG